MFPDYDYVAALLLFVLVTTAGGLWFEWRRKRVQHDTGDRQKGDGQ